MKNGPKTILFCLPGNSFSGRFLDCWTNLLFHCIKKNYNVVVSRHQSCNIYYVRNMCLGGDVRRGVDQKPFDGKLKYDYLFWLDSDIIFSPHQFEKILDSARSHDIVSGVYAMDGSAGEYATVEHWDEEYFKANGSFKFLSASDTRGLIPVDYTGMGFMAVKYGVFERLEYPWFRPLEKRIGDMVDFTMEDVAFCLRAREAEFKIVVDTTVRVGHEKKTVL